MAVASIHAGHRTDTRSTHEHPLVIPVKALGWSLSLFFAISFVLCVLGFLAQQVFQLPLQIAHGFLSIVLPGFEFNSAPRFILGLAESLAWGWYIALIFGPLYNFFATRAHAGPAK